jgi:IS1 family transposase
MYYDKIKQGRSTNIKKGSTFTINATNYILKLIIPKFEKQTKCIQNSIFMKYMKYRI